MVDSLEDTTTTLQIDMMILQKKSSVNFLMIS